MELGRRVKLELEEEKKTLQSNDNTNRKIIWKVNMYTGLYTVHEKEQESLLKRLKHYTTSTSTHSSSSLSTRSFQNSNNSNSNLNLPKSFDIQIQIIPQTLEEQRIFLRQHGPSCHHNFNINNSNDNVAANKDYNNNINPILSLFEQLVAKEHTKVLAQELWKFCILHHDLRMDMEEQDMGVIQKNDHDTNNRDDDDAVVVVPGSSSVGYIDIDSPLLDSLENILLHYYHDDHEKYGDTTTSTTTFNEIIKKNYAVLGTSLQMKQNVKLNSIHGSFLLLTKTNSSNSSSSSSSTSRFILEQMMNKMIDNADEMIHNPLYIGQRLHDLISSSSSLSSSLSLPTNDDEWIFLEQKCHGNPFHTYVMEQQQQQSHQDVMYKVNNSTITKNHVDVVTQQPFYSIIHCPMNQQYCCDIIHPKNDRIIMKTRHILLPYQLFPTNPIDIHKNYNGYNNNNNNNISSHVVQKDLPFITTIQVTKPNPTLPIQETPNFFHQVHDKDCLPTSRRCELCMSKSVFNAGTCIGCSKFCGCFCDMLCQTHVQEKVVTNVLEYNIPKYRKDPTRLIPRIVHQTWYEPISKDKYPNFSRLTESWKQQYGWEYRFYNDDEAADFISTHFPPEVRQAYDDLLPGAFKADLFRYCALFVYGGVYADVDVMLTSKLEVAIDDDVGFMIPQDSKPGEESGHVMCLWNGFIASAPGHPILAKVIETVVNNVRNRFTSLDVLNTLCPDVHFSVGHKYNVLFTTGPCILGATINKMLNRHPQTSFDIGELYLSSMKDQGYEIPGRVVILEGNKADMGAFRFTHTKKNLMIAVTDMPDFDDRETNEKNVPVNHYSKIKKKGHVYGLTGLYKNNKIAHENIRLSISET